MRIVIFFIAISLSFIANSSDKQAEADQLKANMTGLTGGVLRKMDSGSNVGTVSGNYTSCDGQGNCTSTGSFSLDTSQIAGSTQNSLSGSPTEGISATYVTRNIVDITCIRHKTYTLASGVAIKISDCGIDHDNNVYELTASRCNTLFQSGGCDPDRATDWSTPKKFSKAGTLPYVNNVTRQLETDVSATISCKPKSYDCTLTAQVTTKLSGTNKKLGEDANDLNHNGLAAIGGNAISKGVNSDPTFQELQNGMGSSLVECTNTTMFDKSHEGYLLSCDGKQQASISATCTEVVECVQESTTVITSLAKCEVEVPTSSQTCKVDIPSGSCEVFLENMEKTCDTVTPNGHCVVNLENAIKICTTQVPNGTCNNSLSISQPSCVYTVPEGSCDVSKVQSTTTCTNTVKKGECNIELQSFEKTCQEDVQETLDCLMTIDSEEGDCEANARYTTKACTATRAVSEHSCSVKYNLSVTSGGCEGLQVTLNTGNYVNCGDLQQTTRTAQQVILTCNGTTMRNRTKEGGSCRAGNGGDVIDILPRMDQAHETVDYSKDGVYHVWDSSSSDPHNMTHYDAYVKVTTTGSSVKICASNNTSSFTRCETIDKSEISSSTATATRTTTCDALDAA